MGKCQFELIGKYNDFLNCPLDAEEDNKFCYWHQNIEWKRPNNKQLAELKHMDIPNFFLQKACLNYSDLRGVNLRLANLQGADINRANLQEVNLLEANLQRVNLRRTNLREANLSGAKLQGANFWKADLQRANLQKTNLQNAYFAYAILREAYLEMSNLQGANLSEADLRGAHLGFLGMQKVDLRDAYIKGADLRGANFWGADLRGANLIEADLRVAYLGGADLRGADLRKANLEGANLRVANLEGANLSKVDLRVANLEGANLSKADLRVANLEGANLRRANLEGANLEEADLGVANLEEADLRGANLSEADLRVANLGGADLRGADIRGINLTGSNLKSTRFDANSHLEDAVLKNANFYRSYIDSAKTLRDATIFEKEDLKEKEINEQKADEEVYREKKYELYQKSLEVYNKLYHFYSDEGMDFRAKHAHYRRAEVKRKLLLVKHDALFTRKALPDTFKAVFDGLILKTLTGYGESIVRPVGISAFWIFTFGVLFCHFDGIVIEGRTAKLIDYFYLSLTTFTGLGFSNVQPDVNVSVMQPLIMAESTFGVTMVALIIFVVTYQISSR